MRLNKCNWQKGLIDYFKNKFNEKNLKQIITLLKIFTFYIFYIFCTKLTNKKNWMKNKKKQFFPEPQKPKSLDKKH